jgi:hypothetical protein
MGNRLSHGTALNKKNYTKENIVEDEYSYQFTF